MKIKLLLLSLSFLFFKQGNAQCVPTCSNYAMSAIAFTTFPSAGTNVVSQFTPSIDDGATGSIPIGFNFNFYCNTYTAVFICSNGFLKFDDGIPLYFGNPPVSDAPQNFPNAMAPNGIVALNMADFDPNMGGTITYATIGTAPNQKFILTYSNVPMWNYNSSTNTGQIVLYEGSNIIEIHTGAVNVSNTSFYPGSQGIENNAGTLGLNVPSRTQTTWSASSSSYQFSPYTPTPPASITGTNSICQGGQASYFSTFVPSASSYNWSFPPGWVGTSSTTAVTATAGVTGNLSVTATYTCGTSLATVLLVTVVPAPVVNIVSATPNVLCSGKQFTLNAGGAVNYTLEPGSFTGSSPFVVTANSSAVYSLTGENSSGCVSFNTSTVSIIVNPTPTVSVNSGSVCLGQAFTMIPSGATNYTFYNGFNTVNPPLGVTNYSVIGSSPAGCVSDVAISQVTAQAIPNVLAISSRTRICINESVIITASGAGTYSWSTSATTNTISVSPTISTTYTVTGNLNGCSNSTTITQFVSTCAGLGEMENTNNSFLVYPNPNNGTFFIHLNNPEKDAHLVILNLLGELILEQTLVVEDSFIDLKHITAGIYLININTGTNSQIIRCVINP